MPNPDVVKGFDTPEVNAVPMPEVVPHVPEAVPDHTIETEVLSAEEAAPQDNLPASEPVDAALLEPAPVLNAVPAELPASTESSSPPEAEQPATTKSHESLSQQKELEALPEPSIPVSETPTGTLLILHWKHWDTEIVILTNTLEAYILIFSFFFYVTSDTLN